MKLLRLYQKDKLSAHTERPRHKTPKPQNSHLMPVTQCATAAFDDHDLMPLLCRRIAISLKLHETSGGFPGKRRASHDAAFFASLFVNFSAHGRLLRENEDFTRKYTEIYTKTNGFECQIHPNI